MPSTNAARGRRRSGQVAEVAEALLPSPTDEDPPAARCGRLTTSGMSAGATAATSRDQAQGATGSGARYELQPSREKGSRGEPPLGGLWKGADETGQQEEHTRSCAASESVPGCGATSAAHPDVPPGNPAAVATTQRQKEARSKAAAEQLPERGSPVEAQLTFYNILPEFLYVIFFWWHQQLDSKPQTLDLESIDQKVWLSDTTALGKNPKLTPKWLGPYKIVDLNDNNAKLEIKSMFAASDSDVNALKSDLCHLTDQPNSQKGRLAKV